MFVFQLFWLGLIFYLSLMIYSLQVFFFGGRLVFGPDARSILITIFLITAPVIIFCVFVGRKFIDDFPHHRGVSVLAVAIGLNLVVSLTTFVPSSATAYTRILMISFHLSTGSYISSCNLGERPRNHTS